jgi:hypothetical protein
MRLWGVGDLLITKLGYAIGAPSALTENTTRISTDRMVRYELAAFIRNAREVITDPAAGHLLIGQVYSRARRYLCNTVFY